MNSDCRCNKCAWCHERIISYVGYCSTHNSCNKCDKRLLHSCHKCCKQFLPGLIPSFFCNDCEIILNDKT